MASHYSKKKKTIELTFKHLMRSELMTPNIEIHESIDDKISSKSKAERKIFNG